MHRYDDFPIILKYSLCLLFVHLIKKTSYVIYFVYLSRLITKQKVKCINTSLAYVYQQSTTY